MSHKKRGDYLGNPEAACALCGRSDVHLEQDHCHRTGLCRGRVCRSCNLLIGRYDRPLEDIERILEYLNVWHVEHAVRGGRSYADFLRDTSPAVKRARPSFRKAS